VSLPAAASFAGAKVALLESRLADETAAMVRRLGGEPVSAPSVSEVEVDADDAVAALIDRLAITFGSVIVFLTGAAVTRVFAVAERLGRTQALQDGLARAFLVTRGPKPAGVLARRGLSPQRTAAEPFTTADVIAALASLPIADRDVTVVHYGERSEAIVAHVKARGARVSELLVYEWRLPWNVDPLSSTIDRIIGGEIAIVALTSQVQVRHLLEVAADRRAALLDALNARVVVGAVGPTCGAACHAAGIRRVITPERPKLGPLLHALAQEWNSRISGHAFLLTPHD
jgi:uroporphyrinogen-III synthase